jgi:hypothetical protein
MLTLMVGLGSICGQAIDMQRHHDRQWAPGMHCTCSSPTLACAKRSMTAFADALLGAYSSEMFCVKRAGPAPHQRPAWLSCYMPASIDHTHLPSSADGRREYYSSPTCVVPKRRTKVHGAARLAGEAHVQVVGAAHDLPRPRLRLDVVLRDAHDAEEHHRHQHLEASAYAW